MIKKEKKIRIRIKTIKEPTEGTGIRAAKEGDENTRWKREGNGEERHKDNDKWGKKTERLMNE